MRFFGPRYCEAQVVLHHSRDEQSTSYPCRPHRDGRFADYGGLLLIDLSFDVVALWPTIGIEHG